jgi:hypothetical protein
VGVELQLCLVVEAVGLQLCLVVEAVEPDYGIACLDFAHLNTKKKPDKDTSASTVLHYTMHTPARRPNHWPIV